MVDHLELQDQDDRTAVVTAQSFLESFTNGVISRVPVPGQSVRDLRHLKEIICDAHADLQVEDFLFCQIDAQRDLIKIYHMQELEIERQCQQSHFDDFR